MEIAKQTVLITGAGRGLGASLAKAFAKEGANVVVNYFKSKEKAEELVKTLGDHAIAIQADVRLSDGLIKEKSCTGEEHILPPAHFFSKHFAVMWIARLS